VEPFVVMLQDIMATGARNIPLKILIFQDRFDILLEMRLSGIANQGNAMFYGKSQLLKIVF